MNKLLSSFVAAGALAVVASVATPAAAVNFVGNFSVSEYHNGSNNGLNIDLSRTSGNLNFDLDYVFPFDFEYVKLFDIWAGESIGSDDFNADPIKVKFTFTQPSVSGTVSGETEGHWGFIFPNYGTVEWNNVQSFNFGSTGVMKVLLTDTSFGGSNDKGSVYAKFWLESMPSAVPEPGTWALMITGFGLAGAALRRQRKLALSAA